jgi:hypothetical protein
VITLAIDPGLHVCGVAIFDGSALSYAGLLHPREITPELVKPDWLIVELPQVYARSKSKGDPNDLIALAVVVGRLLERFDMGLTVLPRQWKGQCTKAVTEARLKRDLSPVEWARIPTKPKALVHNAVDAAALGHFFLKKMLTPAKP